MLKIKRFRISVIIEAEDIVLAARIFQDNNRDKFKIKQITRLPSNEAREIIKRKLGHALGKLDKDILESLFNDDADF